MAGTEEDQQAKRQMWAVFLKYYGGAGCGYTNNMRGMIF